MTDEAMSPLRRRMIKHMTIRELAPKTQRDYLQRIKKFTAFLGRSPDTATFEDVRRYQLHLATSGVGVSTLNQSAATLRFPFSGHAWPTRHRRAHDIHPGASQAAGRSQSGGGRALARCGAGPQVQGGPERCLWRRIARLRGGGAEGVRYRQQAYGDPGRTRQGPKGSLRDAVGIRIVTFEACSGFTHVTASRIAQPPKAAFVTRLQPCRLPDRAARQLPDQSTTLWVESYSTSDPRLRGALPRSDNAHSG